MGLNLILGLLFKLLAFLTPVMQHTFAKPIAVIGLTVAAGNAKGQGISYVVDNANKQGVFMQNKSKQTVAKIDTNKFTILTPVVRFDSIGNHNDAITDTSQSGLVWLMSDGTAKRTKLNSIFNNATMANLGVMSAQRAADSINSLRSQILSNSNAIASNTAAIATKLTIPSGTTAQYIRGDGSLATLPSPGTGTVTSISSGYGINGGTITNSGTFSVDTSSATGIASKARVTAGLGSKPDTATIYSRIASDSKFAAQTALAAVADSAQYFNATGRIRQKIKTWYSIVSPTTSQSFTVDISSAGFSQILGVRVQSINNTTTLTSIPIAEVRSISNTQVLIHLIQSNSTTVNVLGTSVAGLVFATNLTGMQVAIEVTGY